MKNKNSLETFELGNKPKLREEAIDRENTLMNVLKSVKSKQSKEDLAAAAAETSTTSTKGRLYFLATTPSFCKVTDNRRFSWLFANFFVCYNWSHFNSFSTKSPFIVLVVF